MVHSRRLVAGAILILLTLGFPWPAPSGGASEHRSEASSLEADLEAEFQAGYPLTVRDASGTLVALPRKPQRIISLVSHADDILTELVDHDRLIGVTVFAADPQISNVAAKVADVPNKLTLNVELILSLRPDLVLVADWSEADKVGQLRSAGVPVFQSASPKEVSGAIETIRQLGALVGEEARAEEMVQEMTRRLEAVEKRVGGLHREARKSILDYSNWGTAQGAGSSWDDVVRRAGLVNAAGGYRADDWGQVPLSKEKLLALDPDILILPGWVYGNPEGSDGFLRQILEDPALSTLRAIREKQVYRLPGGLKAATSQYMADAVEYLARLAYPELFQ